MPSFSAERAEFPAKLDPVWARLRQEAEAVRAAEPSLAGLVLATILQQKSLEAAVAHRIAERLDHA
ncbi:MAG: serine O-acetyltransferase, partial [Rhabdaerophilum calidifontis]